MRVENTAIDNRRIVTNLHHTLATVSLESDDVDVPSSEAGQVHPVLGAAPGKWVLVEVSAPSHCQGLEVSVDALEVREGNLISWGGLVLQVVGVLTRDISTILSGPELHSISTL